MFIRKFRGKSMKEVLGTAKAELGQDVVILSQKTTPAGDVELTAATDPPREEHLQERHSVESELTEIKTLLLSLLEERQVMRFGKPALLLYRELKQKGMSEEGARKVVEQLSRGLTPEDLLEQEALRGELRRCVLSQIRTVQPFTGDRMVVTLLGRSGVGKTTTLAKLAAMERMVRKRSVAVVSMDTFKVGGRDELRRIGSLLDIPVGVVYERGDLRRHLESFRSKDTVFVDTPGMGVGEKGVRQGVFDMMTDCPEVQFHLLLSPHYQREVLLRDLQHYDRLSLKSLIVTKMDESPSLGGFVDALLAHPVPISWVTTGREIPRDIERVNKDMLFDRMMEA